jgi:hypothetical protein
VFMRIGERRLLPRVREAGAGTLIVSDGFSCRGQIGTTGKKPLHIEQVLQLALRQRRGLPRASAIAVRRLRGRRLVRRAVPAGAAAAALFTVARARR